MMAYNNLTSQAYTLTADVSQVWLSKICQNNIVYNQENTHFQVIGNMLITLQYTARNNINVVALLFTT